MLVFPYIKGQQFCAAVYARGGFPALSAVYADPPSSTAQILHPEKYFPETRENPIPVNFADTTFRGEKPLDDNVLGEMGCRILFSQSADSVIAEDTADGWRGDRYLVFDQGNILVWKSVWRSPASAALAVAALETMSTRRFLLTFPQPGETDRSSGPDPAHFVRIQILGANEVVFILAPDKESARLLDEKFAGAPHG